MMSADCQWDEML